MKRIAFAVLLVLVSWQLMAAGGKRRQPDWIGDKKDPGVLLFNGGRPWQGDGIAKMLVGTGLRVRNFNSVYLDGFGGASIKAHMSDKVEPKAFDGFTPAFSKLDAKKIRLVMFHTIPDKSYAGIFTPDRVAKIRKYVEVGGNVLFTRRVPAGVVDELLPVEIGEDVTIEDDDEFFANRPAGKAYAGLPEKFNFYGLYRECSLKPGAEAPSTITDASGKVNVPLVARIKIGKGTVTFLNVNMDGANRIKAYDNWAYARMFFAAVCGDSAGVDIKTSQLLTKLEAIPERPQVGETTASLVAPKLGIADVAGAARVSGTSAVFANGMKLDIASDGSASFTWPGKGDALVRKAAVPQVNYSGKQKVFDSSTAEAVGVKEDVKKIDIKWTFSGMQANGNEVVVKYVAPGSEMKRFFKAGTLELDGRRLEGIGERVDLVKCPYMVSSVSFKSEIYAEDPLHAHRNDCYQPPRGYTAFDMSGKTDADTTNYGGQPFEMLACRNGLYIGNRSYPESCGMRLSRKKGAPFISSHHGTGWGRVNAPASTHYYWRWYGDGPERGHHDYLAMYQFMRHMLREKAGLKELPGYPMAEYSYQLRPAEKDAVIEAAGKAGFRYIYPPNPESPIDKIADDNNMEVYEKIVDAGARAHIWTAGSYVQGDGGWIINNHPEWFVRDEKGGFFKYFGTYPVIDVNNKAFYDWYVKLLKKAIDGGVGWVYRDMDGAASGTVNYALPESPNGVQSQIRFYRFFHDNNCRVGVEGQNPLVLDEYWYRAGLCTSFGGQEVGVVGSMAGCGLKGGLTLDAMRTGMYGCFPAFEVSGTVFGVDRIQGEVERGRRFFSLVPKFNAALDLVGMPYVRETEFGTVWIGKTGGALFFWNPAKKVTVDLPAGWKIRGVEGNVLTDVKADSIILVDAAK
ncbi:MAG: hypothetical protein MJ025_06255 [Victivallaceae bacterium]|nr:hypothetical protein [Victivallaceae bacterium]